MKQKIKFRVAVILIMLSFIIFYYLILPFLQTKFEILVLILFTALLTISCYLFGSFNKGRAISFKHLKKGEKVEILRNYHPAMYKLGDKRNISYYMIRRNLDNKIYLFYGPENYHYLPFNKFDFIWDGKKLKPGSA